MAAALPEIKPSAADAWVCSDCGLPISGVALDVAMCLGGPVQCGTLYQIHPVPAVHTPGYQSERGGTAQQLPGPT